MVSLACWTTEMFETVPSKKDAPKIVMAPEAAAAGEEEDADGGADDDATVHVGVVAVCEKLSQYIVKYNKNSSLFFTFNILTFSTTTRTRMRRVMMMMMMMNFRIWVIRKSLKGSVTKRAASNKQATFSLLRCLGWCEEGGGRRGGGRG